MNNLNHLRIDLVVAHDTSRCTSAQIYKCCRWQSVTCISFLCWHFVIMGTVHEKCMNRNFPDVFDYFFCCWFGLIHRTIFLLPVYIIWNVALEATDWSSAVSMDESA